MNRRCPVMGMLFAMSIPGLVLILFLLAAVELSAGRRSWLPWRRGREKKVASGIATEELFAFLYPTKRVEFDQRDTELVLAQREEDGAPPRGKVDLEHGVAIIDLPRRDA